MYNGQYGVATDDNGLYYMRARYYNVDIKRFINQDVVVGGIDRTSSLNRYSYVEGNPVSYLDPFGLEKFDTSVLHTILTVLGIIVCAAALIVAIVGLPVTIAVSATAVVSGLLFAGTIISCIDLSLYVYDLFKSKNEDEFGDAMNGIGWSLLGALPGGGVSRAVVKSTAKLTAGMNVYNFIREGVKKWIE